jgi:hypothetical protein
MEISMTTEELYKNLAEALEYAETAAEVDAIFDQLKQEDPKTVQIVSDKLEANFDENCRAKGGLLLVPREARQEVLDEAKKTDALGDGTRELEGAQKVLQELLNIAKIKGDAASPAIKAHVDELKKLSTEEYNSLQGLYGAMFKAEDKLAPANPFAELGSKPSEAKRPEEGKPTPPRIDRGPGPRCGGKL